ncbi:MAG: type I-E CRISPR-associated protein Cse1/CasA [Dethiosulfovibrio peptidovorans]|nr:MAG: type I-E CRISPR-associated protein Cse1/CasA [Dethiosulfovibrio peptidovorans]
MNLLRDRWIPVTDGVDVSQISLEELLCTDRSYRVSHRRDDMEMAALQLVICLTQTILTPKDDDELIERLMTPMEKNVYRLAADEKADWFDLEHERTPFMQDRRVLDYMKGKNKSLDDEKTGIAKLFPGLPEGKGSGCLFNGTDDIRCLCPSCVALALFNQATGAPSFGGGFKDPLRKATPITTLVYDNDIRRMIWKNVLPEDFISKRFPDPSKSSNIPNWVEQVQEKARIYTAQIGFIRGLFWQPASVFVEWSDGVNRCDGCGCTSERMALSFWKRKFTYDLDGDTWPHPHGARRLNNKGEFVSVTFSGTIPLWARFSDIFRLDSEDHQPAFVLEHYRDIVPGKRLTLSVGGYSNKQASILERHHHTISVGAGWPDHIDDIDARVAMGLEYGDVLEKKAFGFGKNISGEGGGLKQQARMAFFQRTEALMHAALQRTEWDQEVEFRRDVAQKLKMICEDVMEEIARPYTNSPQGIRAYVTAKRTLRATLDKLGASFVPN